MMMKVVVVIPVQTLVKETTLVRETKDKQIGELKKMLEDTAETRRSEFEKKVCPVYLEIHVLLYLCTFVLCTRPFLM